MATLFSINRTSDKVIDEKIRLSSECNKIIGKLMKLASNKFSTDLSFQQIKNECTLAKAVDETTILNICYKNMVKHKDKIRNRDENYFLNIDPEKYSVHNDKNYIVPLINTFNKKKHLLTESEKNIMFNLLNSLLDVCIQYKLLINDTSSYDEYISQREIVLK